MSAQALMPRASVSQLVYAKEEAGRLFGEAYDKLAEAYEMASQAAPSGSCRLPGLIGDDRPYPQRFGSRDEFTAFVDRALDQAVWSHVMRATRMDQLMDRTEREIFEANLRDDPAPATVEYISSTVERLVSDATLMFQRGLATAFAKLDRRFRSHDGFKVGSRIILSQTFSEHGSWNHYRRHDDTLMDVERAFYRLDGKEAPERYGGIVGAADEARRTGGFSLRPFEVETAYFRLKVYANGNAHLWFTRKDLVERVNQTLAAYYGESLGASPDVSAKNYAPEPGRVVAKNFGFYPSPPAVVDRVTEAACLPPRSAESADPPLRVLEPQAGLGALAAAASAAGHDVTCVEIQCAHVAALRTSGLYRRVIQGDFLEQTPASLGSFDRIVCNPPFDKGLDVDHVTHALEFLAPGGLLVAVMSAGAEFRQDRRTVAFRERIEAMGGRFRDLPAGSFAEVGTNVNTCLMIVRAAPCRTT